MNTLNIKVTLRITDIWFGQYYPRSTLYTWWLIGQKQQYQKLPDGVRSRWSRFIRAHWSVNRGWIPARAVAPELVCKSRIIWEHFQLKKNTFCFILFHCERPAPPAPPPKKISINPVPWWGHFTPFSFLHVKKWKCCPTGALNGCRRCIAQGPSDDLILLDVYCSPASFGLQLEHHSVTNPPRLALSYVRAPHPEKDWCVCVFNCHFYVSSRHIFPGDILPVMYCMSAQQRLPICILGIYNLRSECHYYYFLYYSASRAIAELTQWPPLFKRPS